MNLNKVYIIGRLAAEPEMRSTASGQSVATLRVATNRVWNNKQTNQKQEQVEFHTVIAWGRLGEIAQQYLVKGQLAYFEGRLQTRSWQGADGVKRYRTEIVAENLQLGPKASGVPYTGSSQSRPSAPTASSGLARLRSMYSSAGRSRGSSAWASPAPGAWKRLPWWRTRYSSTLRICALIAARQPGALTANSRTSWCAAAS